MHPALQSLREYRTRRLYETIEDAFTLIHFQAPQFTTELGLKQAQLQIEQASPMARNRLMADPKSNMWFSIDLSPIIEESQTEAARLLIDAVGHQLIYAALGAAHADRCKFQARVKPMPAGSFLPGIGRSIEWPIRAGDSVSINLFEDGRLFVDGSLIKQRPWHTIAEFIIPTGDPLLQPPRLDGYQPALLTDNDLYTWDNILGRAAELLNGCHLAKELVSHFGNHILPLVSSIGGEHLSVSFKARPGILYLSCSDNYLEIVEALVHEADHQSLYEAINYKPIFTENPTNSECMFRSPWRNDPRPLSGLFFGLSAFVSVGHFWAEIIQHKIKTIDFAAKRAVVALEQSLDAIVIVQTHGELTEYGASLLTYNQEVARRALDIMRKCTHYSDWQHWSEARRRSDSDRWARTFGEQDRITTLREMESST